MGTLLKNRVPKDCELKADSEMRKSGRGNFVQLVRSDGQVAIVQWQDNKSVVVISNSLGGPPEDIFQRCKVTKQFERTPKRDALDLES